MGVPRTVPSPLPAVRHAARATRRAAGFPVRRLGGDYTAIDRYFYDGQPVATLFAITGSLLFPEGEMFFVRSVRALKDRVSDPDLQADIRAFTGQEASHAGEHRRVNRVVERTFGIDADQSARLMNVVIAAVERLGSERVQLAATAAVEHFTGIVAATLLSDEHFAESITSPAIRTLTMWHAVEECEHRAVAYDTYQAAGGTYAERAAVMVLATAAVLGVYGATFLGLLADDGQVTNARSWAHFVEGSLRRDGLLRPVLRRYWSWYRPGFHPHDEDTHEVEELWRARLSLTRADGTVRATA